MLIAPPGDCGAVRGCLQPGCIRLGAAPERFIPPECFKPLICREPRVSLRNAFHEFAARTGAAKIEASERQ